MRDRQTEGERERERERERQSEREGRKRERERERERQTDRQAHTLTYTHDRVSAYCIHVCALYTGTHVLTRLCRTLQEAVNACERTHMCVCEV